MAKQIIKSITKKRYKGYVHNLAVKGDETFYANDILVHNCRSVLVGILIEEKNDPDSFFFNYDTNKGTPEFGTNIPDGATKPAVGFGG